MCMERARLMLGMTPEAEKPVASEGACMHVCPALTGQTVIGVLHSG